MTRNPLPTPSSDPGALLLAATAATRAGDFAAGSSGATAALDGFRARADDDGRMRSQNLLGVIAYENGELDQAERKFNATLELALLLGDNLMTARSSNNLASIVYLRNDTLGALTLFRSALLSYQRLGDRRGMAESYHNLGIVFREMEQWPDAMNAADQAVRVAEQIEDPGLLGLAMTGRAEISLGRGETAVAQQELLRAGYLAGEAGDEIGIIEIGRVQALLFLATGEYHKAVEAAEAARLKAETAGAIVLQAECAAAAARAWRALGNRGQAHSRHREAKRLFQAQGATRRLRQLEHAFPEV